MNVNRIPSECQLVLDYWALRMITSEMTPGTAARYGRVFASFQRFVAARGCSALIAVDQQTCRAFVTAPRGGRPPAPSTSRFRLTVVRNAFVALLLSGVTEIDPTAGLTVAQPAQIREPVPLTPAEAARLRSAGRISPRDHVRPTAVELALAGGSHVEIAATVVADVDLAGARVHIGSRISPLDQFATTTLAARIASCRLKARRGRCPWDPGVTSMALARQLDAYPDTSIAPSISSSLRRAMVSAGLTRPGLRPASVREYAANRRYALTGRVEDVAAFLGLGSLDVARGYIDLGWQDRYGP
jgi:integrase